MRRFNVTFRPLRPAGPNTTWLLASRPSVWRLGFTDAASNVWAQREQAARESAVIAIQLRISLLAIVPEQPAIYHDSGSGDVVRVGGGEERDHARNIRRLSQAMQRDVIQQGLQQLWVVQQFRVDGRLNRSRSDVVDRDAQGRQFDGEVA